jgi:hypothetical protein
VQLREVRPDDVPVCLLLGGGRVAQAGQLPVQADDEGGASIRTEARHAPTDDGGLDSGQLSRWAVSDDQDSGAATPGRSGGTFAINRLLQRQAPPSPRAHP